MSSVQCPICSSENHHHFWFWEKEDKLVRDWALDTRLTFSICRDCCTIFQSPKVESTSDQGSGFGSWGDSTNVYPADEPLMWLKQFTQNGEKKGKALEIYRQEKRFESQLQQDGWEVVKTISESSLVGSSDGSFSIVDENAPAEGETFDVVFCFDLLSQTNHPVELLHAVHPYVNQDGGIYVEVNNPSIQPRINKLCLSSTEKTVFPFHSLVFTLHKAGFMNTAAEMSGKLRCFCSKIDPNPDTLPSQVLPEKLWEHTLYRFQRNYNWAKTAKYLQDYISRIPNEPNLVETARTELHQDQNMLQIVRDVCGGTLLFAQEVNELQKSLSEDWFRSMNRIFEVFKNDMALYDILQVQPIQGLGVFEGVERFHFNEKMIYMTNEDYFKNYFTEDDARQLCTGIIQSGQVVCGHLSSFL